MTDHSLGQFYKYRGWRIAFDEKRPVTSRYVADRDGVTMNAATLDSLEAMIRQRMAEESHDEHLRQEKMP